MIYLNYTKIKNKNKKCMTNEQTCNPNCDSCDEHKSQKHVFNADFAFIAASVATLHSFLMVYSVVFLS